MSISVPLIYLFTNGWPTIRMNVKEKRLIKLMRLIEEERSKGRSAADLARDAETDPAYIYQITSPNNPAQMGDDLARRLERCRGKPNGWMDVLEEEEVCASLSREIIDLAVVIQSLSPAKQSAIRALLDTPTEQAG